MTAARPASPLALLAGALLLVALTASVTLGNENETPEAQADALHADYVKHVKYTDFATFSKRMASIRALGKLETPRARKHLLAIAKTAKGIDDRIVAFNTMGDALTIAEAKELAGVVSRKRDPLLTQALGQAYMLATGKDVLRWLATDALEIKEPSVLEAVLDAAFIHGDARARERLRAVFEAHSERQRGVVLAYGALRALGAIADERDRTFLLRTPSYDDWRLRLAGADTIARQSRDDANVLHSLTQYLRDDSPVVREAAAESIAAAKLVELTDALAGLLDYEHVRTRKVAHEALVAMHHTDVGWDPADWKRWWKARTGVPKDIRQEPSTSVTTYYGVKVHSDRILFIIDLSGSMAFPWGKETAKTRIGVAKRELTRAIDGLDGQTLFNVIVFSDNVKPWRKQGETLASKDAKADALRWVDKVFKKPEGGTFMHAALETAFEQNPQVDTIFLLTDGLATDGEPIVPEAILASVNRWNRFRRAVVHTFALTLEDLEPDGLHKANLAEIKKFMRRLATLTGGEARVVTKPPKTAKSK